ncbi:MAG: 50S ribosomal protein L22 [Acidimicrobiales bacterium]|nr:MAG: 50S ribosomal protein L22 [Acidimicrobiales bacterium]
MSATKARRVLDLIRGQEVGRAAEILRFCERDAAIAVGKLLASAVANAEHNDSLAPDDLFVSACFADEGTTIKRWRPRARGRATRIRKRSCHITVIVGRLPDDRLGRRRRRQAADTAALRAQRVAGGRRGRRGERTSREEQAASAPPVAAAGGAPPVAAAEGAPPVAPVEPADSAVPGGSDAGGTGAGGADAGGTDDEGTRE